MLTPNAAYYLRSTFTMNHFSLFFLRLMVNSKNDLDCVCGRSSSPITTTLSWAGELLDPVLQTSSPNELRQYTIVKYSSKKSNFKSCYLVLKGMYATEFIMPTNGRNKTWISNSRGNGMRRGEKLVKYCISGGYFRVLHLYVLGWRRIQSRCY